MEGNQPIKFPSERVAVSELGEYITNLSCKDGFYHQFKNIPSGERYKVTHGIQPYALDKNRYSHIFPYDHSRVKLNKIGDSEESTYINACFMKQYNGQICIASQGPMTNTIPDFWRMIWEQNCAKIVMLANIMEKGKINCEQYWPGDKSKSEQYGGILVEFLEEDIRTQFTLRKFKISQNKESRTIHQFHFTGWVDLNVPSISTGLLEMRQCITECEVSSNEPTVFHCRAGVGRTGTYLTIDYLLNQADAEGHVDVVKCLHLLRYYRMNTIETLPQYEYVYHTILEALYCKNGVNIPCTQFMNTLENIKKQHQETGKTEIEKQFQVLNIINEENNHAAVQNTMNDPKIFSSKSEKQVFREIQGYRASDRLFITEMPHSEARPNFWKFILENNIDSVVMLNELKESESYWPQNETVVTYNELKLTRKSMETTDDIIITDILVEVEDNKECRSKIKHYQCQKWSTDECLPKRECLIALYNCIRKNFSGNILIHCQNTNVRSGLFCALHHMVEKMTEEKTIDIFNAVKRIRQSEPQLIPNIEQYEYLYTIGECLVHSQPS